VTDELANLSVIEKIVLAGNLLRKLVEKDPR
jgi:hypothetical protein